MIEEVITIKGDVTGTIDDLISFLNEAETSTEAAIVGNTVLPAVYHCKSCGFISTRRKEYTYIKGVMFCVGCKEDYEGGVENVTRWVTSALNGR